MSKANTTREGKDYEKVKGTGNCCVLNGDIARMKPLI
jgi:hypothetical protein